MNSKNIEEISWPAFSREIPSAVAYRIGQLASKSRGDFLIPNHEDLRVGDIVMTRPQKRNGELAKSPVVTAQEAHGFDAEHAQWSHVSIYVGDLHILEAQKGFILGSGVQLKPIVKYTQQHKFQILRHSNPKYDAVRAAIARYALLDYGVRHRRYDLTRAWRARGSKQAKKSKVPNWDRSILCSEFVLQCLAIGGKVLVKEYDSVVKGEHQQGNGVFLPANFASHPDFKPANVGFRKLFVPTPATTTP